MQHLHTIGIVTIQLSDHENYEFNRIIGTDQLLLDEI